MITCVTPGENVDILVTDHGVAVNTKRPDLIEALSKTDIPLFTIEQLCERAYSITGKPKEIEFTNKPVAVVRYRDGSVIDTVYQVKD